MIGGGSPAGASENDWNRLKVCESGNNYSTNTGNGYYGAYQFDLQTWHGVGGSGLPSNASPHTQDLLARKLYRERGWAPWECARILGLKADPSNGYLPVTTITPTISAPRAKAAGSTVKLSGRATASSRVVLYEYQVGLWKTYHAVKTLKASSAGQWATALRLNHTSRYFVKASGRKSKVATTNYLYRTTIYGAGAVLVNNKYSIIGGARPNSVVQMYFRRAGGHSFISGARVRADSHGHYRVGWRANTDYQYFARSDTQSAIGLTRIATTASGSMSMKTGGGTGASTAGTTDVPLAGTARPGALVHVFVRHGGQKAWRTVATVHARRSGRWAVNLRAANSFTYFARSSTHLQSHIYTITIK
jgi:hypothetical protein